MTPGWACAAGKPRTASEATEAFPPFALAFALPLALPLAFAPAQGAESLSEKRLEAHHSVIDLLRRSRGRPGRKQVCNNFAEMVWVAPVDECFYSGSQTCRLWNQLQMLNQLATYFHAVPATLYAEVAQS